MGIAILIKEEVTLRKSAIHSRVAGDIPEVEATVVASLMAPVNALLDLVTSAPRSLEIVSTTPRVHHFTRNHSFRCFQGT